ncbi:MAG: hypothetical protein ACO25E_13540, partial [Burkholderiaceae bacterium]
NWNQKCEKHADANPQGNALAVHPPESWVKKPWAHPVQPSIILHRLLAWEHLLEPVNHCLEIFMNRPRS